MQIAFCVACGRVILKSFSFCPYCGNQINLALSLHEVMEAPFTRLEAMQASSVGRQIDHLLEDLEILEAEMDDMLHDLEAPRR
jgi:hypothetical protein